MSLEHAKYSVGQVIQHRLFGYRGVIVGVDPVFSLSDSWYDQMARSRPPKDRPWCHVLVHDSETTTYVAERNLEPDFSGDPIRHPLVDALFDDFRSGRYLQRREVH